MTTDSYRTIAKPSEGIFKDKGSRFIGLAFSVKTEQEIKDLLLEIKKKYHDATHHCYAYSIGINDLITTRTSDDGEPSSTAGKPILGQIKSNNLQNILIVVVRYFGGTKLGVSGLINAYREAAKETINNAQIIEVEITQSYKISFDYQRMNAVMQILKNASVQIKKNAWENEKMQIVFCVLNSQTKQILNQLQEISNVDISDYK